MFKKRNKSNSSDRKYYVLNSFLEIIPLENYKFDKTEIRLQSLADSECFFKKTKSKGKNSKLEEIINEMGFEWEPLSEPGQMRQMSHATIIMEAIEKYSWLTVEQFSNEQNFPIHRISGGELFNSNRREFKKQISLISNKPTLYGANHYNVIINGRKQILRYSSCTQKLSVARELNFFRKDLPVGLFEISKSYRFEEKNELQLCNRIRSFHLPELHVLTNSFNSSQRIALSTHLKILEEIIKFDPEYELLCSVTYDFFKENMEFLKAISKSIKKPLLLVVYNENVPCKDGVKIDIEYKVFDVLGLPVEISTFQIDDGVADSAFNVKYQSNKNFKKSVSTIHVVFNASIERFVYFLLNRAVRKEKETGFKELPFWFVPIQARVIAYDQNSLKDAKKLAEELSLLNFRTDLDDREIHYNTKKKEKDLSWIPYVITVNKNNKGLKILSVDNKIKRIIKKTMSKKDLIKEMDTEQGRNIIVPRYVPILLSKRLVKN